MKDVPVAVAIDATAVTGRVGVKKYCGKNILVGFDHRYDKCAVLDFVNDGSNQVITDEGVINGLNSVTKLEDSGDITRVTQCSTLVLVPLMKNSFHYCLLSLPTGSYFKSEELTQLYDKIRDQGKKVGLSIFSIPGDGDPRLVKHQQNNYNFFTPRPDFLSKLEFPLRFGFSSKMDVPMQDVLHVLKKLRNQMKYLSTRAILMSTPKSLNTNNRLKFSVRWDILYIMWNASTEFRFGVSKSCILLTDKQDPTLATELSAAYAIAYQMGYDSLGLYLECMHLILVSFYDKILHPLDRLRNISTVRTVFILWREAMLSAKMLGKHFITPQTFKDLMCCLEGFILYIWNVHDNFPTADIVPWLYTSDPCEFLFAFCRIGRHKGRRTNLDMAEIGAGMEAKNRSLDFDREGLHLLDHEVAHARGRSLLKGSAKNADIVIYKGKDLKDKEFKDTLDEGAEIGRFLFTKYSNFETDIDSGGNNVDVDVDYDGGTEESDGDELDVSGENISVDQEDKVLNSREVFYDGIVHHINSLVQHYVNKGRSKLVSKERSKRFHKTNVPIDITPSLVCPTDPGSSCDIISVGSKGSFSVKGVKGVKGDTIVRGQVFFISLVSSYSHTNKTSSVKNTPVEKACWIHGSIAVWVKSELCGNFFIANKRV